MNILITGIAGFVGASLCDKLINKKKINIIGIDNFSYGDINRIKPYLKKIKLIKKDICDLNINDFKDIKKIDVLIHLAAIAPLPDNQTNPYESIKNNVAGTANMLELSRLLGINKIIFMSSGAIYEKTKYKKNGFHENDKIDTVLMYPTSKFFGEKICDIFHETYKIPIVKIRLFNLYGPQQDYHRKHPPLLSQLIQSVIKNKIVEIYNLNKNIKRDYIYIDDLVALLIKLLSKPFNKKAEVINACSGESLSVPDIISIIETVSKKKLKIIKSKKVQNFWGKYENLFNGPYPIDKKIIENEIYKSANGDSKKFKKIILKKPTPFIKGIKKCLEYAETKL